MLQAHGNVSATRKCYRYTQPCVAGTCIYSRHFVYIEGTLIVCRHMYIFKAHICIYWRHSYMYLLKALYETCIYWRRSLQHMYIFKSLYTLKALLFLTSPTQNIHRPLLKLSLPIWRSLLNVSFEGLFWRSLLNVSFECLFWRSLLKVSLHKRRTFLKFKTCNSLLLGYFSTCRSLLKLSFPFCFWIICIFWSSLF